MPSQFSMYLGKHDYDLVTVAEGDWLDIPARRFCNELDIVGLTGKVIADGI